MYHLANKRLLAKAIRLCVLLAISLGVPAQKAHASDQHEPQVDIFGRLLLDYAHTAADQAGLGISSTRLRNARIGASVTYGSDLKVKIELNRSNSHETNLTDGYLDWRPAENFGIIRVGQFRTPNALDEQTSLRFASMQERAAFTDAFGLDRRIGVAYTRNDSNYTFTVGAFGNNLDTPQREKGAVVAARGTFAPVINDKMLVHLGVSARHRSQDDGTTGIRYRQRPFTRVHDRITGTVYIARSDLMIGLEKAVLYEGFWVAGEYARLSADCPSCSKDPDFQGHYTEAGYVFGGRRQYKGGRFGRFKVHNPATQGGMGAFVLTARYDTLDLVASDTDGGSQESYIFGTDWWLNHHVKLSMNYFISENTLGSEGAGLNAAFMTTSAPSAETVSIDGFQLRTQVDF